MEGEALWTFVEAVARSPKEIVATDVARTAQALMELEKVDYERWYA